MNLTEQMFEMARQFMMENMSLCQIILKSIGQNVRGQNVRPPNVRVMLRKRPVGNGCGRTPDGRTKPKQYPPRLSAMNENKTSQGRVHELFSANIIEE